MQLIDELRGAVASDPKAVVAVTSVTGAETQTVTGQNKIQFQKQITTTNKTKQTPMTKNTATDSTIQPNAAQMLEFHKSLRRRKWNSFKGTRLGSPCNGNTDTSNDVCGNLEFPLLDRKNKDSKDPAECWPRLVIQPSFPTSGSFVSRMLFTLNTGLASGHCERGKPHEIIFDWEKKDETGIPHKRKTKQQKQKTLGNCFQNVGDLCPANLGIPYAGRVAYLKTHARPWRHFDVATIPNFIDGETNSPQNIPSHVVRLVRNPGDNLLRNAARWSGGGGPGKLGKALDYESCNLGNIQGWVEFHEDWQKASEKIPTIVLRYEEITNLDTVQAAMERVLDFIGEERSFEVNYEQVVKVPQYQPGGELKKACGIDKARELHKKTKHVTAAMGYDFDVEEGVWTLANINN